MLYSKPYSYFQSYKPAHYNWHRYDWNYSGNPFFNVDNHYGSKQNFSYRKMILKDYGARPFVVNINEAAKQNKTFRTALWTGSHLQVTLMSIQVGEDIGLEIHPALDQFLRIEDGQGFVQMGDRKDHLYIQKKVGEDDAIMVPAGTWHNVINTGSKPLKLYSIYAPPQHPFGTVHETKAIAMAAEEPHS